MPTTVFPDFRDEQFVARVAVDLIESMDISRPVFRCRTVVMQRALVVGDQTHDGVEIAPAGVPDMHGLDA